MSASNRVPLFPGTIFLFAGCIILGYRVEFHFEASVLMLDSTFSRPRDLVDPKCQSIAFTVRLDSHASVSVRSRIYVYKRDMIAGKLVKRLGAIGEMPKIAEDLLSVVRIFFYENIKAHWSIYQCFIPLILMAQCR